MRNKVLQKKQTQEKALDQLFLEKTDIKQCKFELHLHSYLYRLKNAIPMVSLHAQLSCYGRIWNMDSPLFNIPLTVSHGKKHHSISHQDTNFSVNKNEWKLILEEKCF